MDNVETSHNATYSEVYDGLGVVNVINNANYSDILNVCLESEVANITHRVCHIIDTAKELQKSGQGHTGPPMQVSSYFPLLWFQTLRK